MSPWGTDGNSTLAPPHTWVRLTEAGAITEIYNQKPCTAGLLLLRNAAPVGAIGGFQGRAAWVPTVPVCWPACVDGVVFWIPGQILSWHGSHLPGTGARNEGFGCSVCMVHGFITRNCRIDRCCVISWARCFAIRGGRAATHSGSRPPDLPIIECLDVLDSKDD